MVSRIELPETIFEIFLKSQKRPKTGQNGLNLRKVTFLLQQWIPSIHLFWVYFFCQFGQPGSRLGHFEVV